MSEPLRLMSISAHAADFCSRSGGTIAKYARQGSAVRVLDLTFGEACESGPLWEANPDRPVEEVKAIRRQEVEEAVAVLGAEARFLDLTDGPLFVDREKMLRIMDEIRAFRPDIVLTHAFPEPVHPDHHTTVQSVLVACTYAGAPGTKTAHPPASPRAIFLFEPTIPFAEFAGFNPDTYIDITDVFDIKIQALKCLRTQDGLVEGYTHFALHRALQARTWGGNQKIRYAEAFKRYRPWVGNYFPM